MVDYTYYQERFGGRRIPPEDFEGLLRTAQARLEWLMERYHMTPRSEEAEPLALCALAETLHDREDPEVVQKSVGEVSLRYGKRRGQTRAMYHGVAPYFKVYRGVSDGKPR